MKRDYDEVLSEYGISAYDETSQGAAMTQREELNADQKKLNWLLGLEKETLADMAHQQSKIIEKLQQAAKAQAVPNGYRLMPPEPTPEMIKAWRESTFSVDPDENLASGYDAMFLAAPEVK